MNLAPAKSQKAADRPISFILEVKGSVRHHADLFIRPEDLSITTPTRMSVTQTLGGAWVDEFGQGLDSITLSGTLGWRTGQNGLDGIERLLQMKEQFHTTWHAERAKAIALGSDPNEVKLRYVDTLNRYSKIVAPQVFEIRRSKSQPLLGKYRFSLMAIDKSLLPAASAVKSGADPSGLGVSSLLGSIQRISAAANNLRSFVNGQVLDPVRGFVSMSQDVLGTVHGIISSSGPISGPVIGIARDVAQVGTNLFRTLAAAQNLPMHAKAELMQIAGAYSNAFCVMKNALKTLPTYEDYRALHGSSNCSSTSGGSPPSQYIGQNTFAAVAPIDTSAVSVSPRASAALGLMIRNDIVHSPMQPPAMNGALIEIAAGVLVR